MSKPSTFSVHRPHNNLQGIWLMLTAFALFSVADTIAKVLTADYEPIQIVFLRQIGLVTIVLFLMGSRGLSVLKSVAPRLQFIRGVFAAISATCFVTAVAYVPLADAVAVTYAAPFMVTILAAVLLGERVGLNRWLAVLAGFIGTMVILRPGSGTFHPAIFLPLLAAAAFAARQVISRYIGSRDQTLTTLVYTALTSLLVLALPLPWFWTNVKSLTDFGLIITMAVIAGFGEYMIIRSLEIAYAYVVSPMHYSLIIFSTFWGYFIFGDLPDFWTWTGAAIVVVSGLYMVVLEARKQRKASRADG